MQNGQDLAPNFAGSIYSLINFVGTTSGFLTPMVVAFFTRNGVRYLSIYWPDWSAGRAITHLFIII